MSRTFVIYTEKEGIESREREGELFDALNSVNVKGYGCEEG